MDEGRDRVGQQPLRYPPSGSYSPYPPEDAPVAPVGASVHLTNGPASPTWPGSSNAASEAERYELARKRVQQVRKFYQHLSSYIFVNFLLFFINLVTSPGHWWFYWALFGWGIGLLSQAWHVFAPRFDRDWEERKIQQELRKNP